MLFQDYFIDNFDFFFKQFKNKNRATYESKYHSNYLTIKGFEQDIKFRKENLISAIKSKTFRFSKLYPVVVFNKKNPEKQPRLICIPTIQDRLVQMILIKYLAEHRKDDLAMFKSSDFAVEGLGIIEARKEALKLRNTEKFVLKTDISAFFDNLDRQRLRKDFKETLPEDLLYLFDSVVGCDCFIPQDYSNEAKIFITSKQGKGVRQGMPLSPLIASFYLSQFDEWLEMRKLKYVRYADDLIFFLDAEEQCRKVFRQIEGKLKEIGLSLPTIEDNTKTQVVRPFEEVLFLGLNIRYENNKYNWYIPSHIIRNVEDSLNGLTSVSKNIQKGLTLVKTITRIEQIVVGYEHCYKDAESKNLNDFKNRLHEVKVASLNTLFNNIGLDMSNVSGSHWNYLVGVQIKSK